MSYLELCDCGTFLVAHTARRPNLSGACSARSPEPGLDATQLSFEKEGTQFESVFLTTMRDENPQTSVHGSCVQLEQMLNKKLIHSERKGQNLRSSVPMAMYPAQQMIGTPGLCAINLTSNLEKQ
ncbi:hypothetical protein PGT21_013165 [Puccinia graminis f. sp. tritici]|uniref:Uncharacterized protein n=1 Tax=Puccinia graminis f. sp. tritici TaxID=56615 RepID=A0A5B0MC80_PUCGR|nr:hypothetical protein PGT21_013165 [Puccinia graminis f. sp. tritici]KAA1122082.1 hypothetical protein PGTUg99_026191 [Puccinia graminis f. sp. tritici]